MTERTCTIEGCPGPHYGRGLCAKHYQRWRKTGSVEDPDRSERSCSIEACTRKHKGHGLCAPHLREKKLHEPTTVCGVDGCGTAVLAKGLCSKHYQRMKIKGSLEDPVVYTPEERKQAFRDANRRYRERHPELVKQRSREYYRLNCEAEAERRRRYYADNPEKIAELGRRWRAANPGRHAELYREWVKANPERIRAIWTAKGVRRRKRARATTVEIVHYEKILAEFGMRCHICGGDIASRADLHMDHVVPLARGGTHTYGNIRPSHVECNLRKGSKLMSELVPELI